MILCRRIGHGYQAGSVAPLCLIAPSCCSSRRRQRGLVGAIVSRFEAKGLTIAALDLRTLDKETLARHLRARRQGVLRRPRTFMSRGPVVAMVIEGPDDTWEVVRNLMGATNPRKADPGTIRGDLGILLTENLVHGSDSRSRPSARSTSSSRNCNLRRS